MTLTTVTADERSAALDSAIVEATRQGWRTLSRSPFQAQLVKGKPTNHILHLILTLLTLGLWAIVWIAMAVLGGEKQRLVTVNEQGLIQGVMGVKDVWDAAPCGGPEELALERLAEAAHAQAFAVAWREKRYVEAAGEWAKARQARAEADRIEAQLQAA